MKDTKIKQVEQVVGQYFDGVETELDQRGLRGWMAMVAASLKLIWEYVREFVARVPRRMRALLMITLALCVLVMVAGFVSGRVLAYIADTSGPFLDEALQAPYAFHARPLPALGATADTVLPDQIGGYLRINQLEVDQDTLDVLMPPAGALGRCLLAFQNYRVAVCADAIEYAAAGASLTIYDRPGNLDGPVYVYVAQFGTPEIAGDALVDLRGYARTIGRTGDFALRGVAATDFFESSTRGWFSFTWTRGPWMFQVAARSQANLTSMLEAFPY